MTKKKQQTTIVPPSGTVLDIPLNRLKKSPNNARKTPHPKADIEALAASIVANGMLQSPVVEPEIEDGRPTGCYLVTIGEGRRQAQLLRAKRREISKTNLIRCVVEYERNAFEISLAENAVRSDMHPADQFEAFFKLHGEHGLNAEDIAARFGVTAAVVKQRLKLAAVSPKLIQAYREDGMNLDQLTAFAITDDHAKQEAVWEALPEHDNDREAILAALTEEQVRADDRRAVFVGTKAYEAAGGAIIRDLFAEEGEGYFVDAALLDRLAQEKLQTVAETVRAEGWKWIEVMAEFDHGFTAEMRRVYPEPIALSEEDQAKHDALQARYEQLCDQRGESEETEAELDRLEAEMEALTGPEQYDPQDIARGGAIVTLASTGEPRIERGFIRSEDDTSEAASRPPRNKQRDTAQLSDKLIAELSAYHTIALRDALAQHSGIALTAVVHAFAGATFFPHGPRQSCLQITAHSAFLGAHAPGIEDSPAGQEIAERHEAWAKALPSDVAALWDHISAMEHAERLALLAHCVALTVDAVRVPHPREKLPEEHIGQLSQAVQLDMAANWKPTAAAYFGRVSKERILEAVREAVSKEAADNIKGLKKLAMAEAAEKRMRDSRWLPPLLRPRADPALAIAAE